MTPRSITLPAVTLLAFAALGCASQGPKPTQELTRASTMIQQADKGNAQRYAAADLQKAHDELRSAQSADSDGKYDRARRFAEAAAVDADVAMARGDAGEARQSASQVQKGTDTLRNEADRNQVDHNQGNPGVPQ